MLRLAACLSAAVLLVPGCSHVGAGGSAAAPGDRALRLVEAQDPPGFDPLISDNADLQDFVEMIDGFLLKADASGTFTPDLVTRIPSVRNGDISRDGLTIRYRLRRGVRWQDGTPFDARDVVFSFRAAMNPNNDVPDRSGFDDVASVRAPDPYDVVVRLRRPYSPALATFFSSGANDPYAILPAHLLAGLHDLNQAPYNEHPIGLGPYRVVSWEHGNRIELAADPHYRFGAPKIARIDIRIVPDTNTQLALWESRELDFFMARGFAGSRAMLEGARSVRGAREYPSDHYQFNYLMFNTAGGPLSDLLVREALVRGIDRDRIDRDVRGELNRSGDGDRLPGQFAYDPSIREASYDPRAAAALLDKAGWTLRGGMREKNGVPLSLQIVGVSNSLGSDRFDVQIQAALRSLGIASTVKTYQYDLLFNSAQMGGIYASGKFDITYYAWQPGEDADHSYLFRCDTRPPNGENYGRICDPAIDRAARAEIDSVDPAVQIAADRAMLRELDARADVDFLGFDREFLFADADLGGIRPSVLGRHYWNVADWYWKR